MSQATSHLSEGSSNEKKRVNLAAGIVAAGQKLVGVAKAMELVGFSQQEIKTLKLYQQVRRRAQKLCVVEKKNTPPLAVVVPPIPPAASEASSLTSNSPPAFNLEVTVVTVRGNLDLLANAAVPDPPYPTTPQQQSPKKLLRASKQLQDFNAKMAEGKERNKKALKVVTKLIEENNQLDSTNPAKKTINSIVNETNTRFHSTINAKTAGRYVRLGMIGQSPLKKGPVGTFPKPVYAALMGAYTTYLKLEQAHSKKQSGIKEMAKLVNAILNSAGYGRTRDDLVRKLRKDTANHFSVSKANVTEARRVLWTTSYNLNVWFTTFKELCIDLGFAREKLPNERNVVGELVFPEDQLRRIINVDETDGSIDDTTGQRGGRPSMTFIAPDVAGGATSVNKSGYSSTIICGSNAAGEPVPPHFQLKTMAQTNDREKLSVDWFCSTKNIIAQFGHSERKSLPCTFGMNEKAGMNDIELGKYINNSILPLYPDIEDTPSRWVILKVDSGPGRTNIDMLANLRVLGLYLVPGVPNTTSQTQETDQNYGPFKGSFRSNIRLLSQSRFEKGMTLQVSDIPLLVFGGKCLRTGVELEDSFTKAFSIEANLSCWMKCGAVPLTRQPLLSNLVRREVPVGDAAAIVADELEDPRISLLKRLEAMNRFYCDILLSHGFNSNGLRLDAPKRVTYVGVTDPNSQQRVKAIKEAKTAGQMFYATGGQHINSDEFFKARELKKREPQIKAMEDLKQKKIAYCYKQVAAVRLIKQKGELTWDREKLFTVKDIEILLKWKKVKPSSKRKRDLIEAYCDAPKPKIQATWCRSEEAALQRLKSEVLSLKETAVGIATSQMARAVTNNLSNLDPESIAALKLAIGSLDQIGEEEGPNVI
jgi:hypothetical protein